jgi:hypothetical protein
LAITNTINLYIYKKYKETFPSRIKIFKYIFINTCNKQVIKAPQVLTDLNIIKAKLYKYNTTNNYIIYIYIKLLTRFSPSQVEKLYYINIDYTRPVIREN